MRLAPALHASLPPPPALRAPSQPPLALLLPGHRKTFREQRRGARIILRLERDKPQVVQRPCDHELCVKLVEQGQACLVATPQPLIGEEAEVAQEHQRHTPGLV